MHGNDVAPVLCIGSSKLQIKSAFSLLTLCTLACRFPGSDFAWNAVNDVTDVDLLSDATIYLSTHKACENQAYNINNGDLFRWSQLWPKIAKHFNMETGPNLHINLVQMMGTPEKKDLWAKTVKVSNY